MIDSPDATLTRCIKDNSWTSYFTRYGNNVTISTDYTTRGVQIIATSGDAQIISDLQNAQWSRILRSAPRVSTSTQSPIYYYDTPSYNSYHGNNYNNNYNNSPQYNYQPYTYNPVSYTHLDVYKRQTQESSCIHVSHVRNDESDGPSRVTVCPSARANAYPSPVEPV